MLQVPVDNKTAVMLQVSVDNKTAVMLQVSVDNKTVVMLKVLVETTEIFQNDISALLDRLIYSSVYVGQTG
jgi:hypothetical protein